MLIEPDRRWLDRRLRVLLLVAVALLLATAPMPGSGPASASNDADTATELPVADDLAGALTDDGRVELLYFGSATCPYCQRMESYLEDLEETFAPPLDVVEHEVSRDTHARDRWERELLARGHAASGVPTTILGDRVWIGFDDHISREITRAVASLASVAGPGQTGRDDGTTPDEDRSAVSTAVEPLGPDETSIPVPVVGEVELSGRSAIGITALIAFVDGFNPCSLWVLAILLAMVLNAGATRTRIVLVGVTFLTVTAAIYGAFIVGIVTVVELLSSISVIAWVVGAIALMVGLVNIKDYFAYKQGLSFTIPDRFKPRIYRGGRAIRDHERPLPAVLGTTVVLAAGVALVELPCTMGFPVIWTGLLQTMDSGRGAGFTGLLALYLLIYIGLELVLFAIVVATMQVARMEEKHGRALKLVGGSLMVVLGVAMIWFQTLLDDLTGLLVLTLAAIGLSGVLVLLNRVRRDGGARGDRDRGRDAEARGPSTSTAPGRGSATSGRR